MLVVRTPASPNASTAVRAAAATPGSIAPSKRRSTTPTEITSPGSGRDLRAASRSRRSAQSSAVVAIGPIVSTDHDNGTIPRVGTSPVEGRRPVTPQNADGIRIEPAVSVPSVAGTRPAATAAPLPPLEPPQTRSSAHGLHARP